MTVLDPPAVLARLSGAFVTAGLMASLPGIPTAGRLALLGWIAGGSVEPGPLAELGVTALETFRVRQPPPSRPSAAELADVPVPVLALLAGRSRVHDVAAAARAARAAGWRVERWPDAGHDLHAAFPRRLAASIAHFVDDVDAGRARGETRPASSSRGRPRSSRPQPPGRR